MTQARIVMPSEERMVSERPHLICWKSVFAGLLLSITAFVLLTSLGAGIAGFTAEGMINKEDGGSALATGAGLWLGISVVISLFCGKRGANRE